MAYDAHEMFSEIANPWVRVRRGYWRRTEGRLLPHCLVATTVNEFIADEMGKRYNVPAPDVIYNCPRKPQGFNPDERHPYLREALGLSPETRIVLYQGWMAEGRGLEELIEGAAHLRGANAVLALLGYGDYKPQLQSLAAFYFAKNQFISHPLDARHISGLPGQVELLALQRRGSLRLEVRQVALVVDARALVVGREEGAAVIHCSTEVRRRIDRDVPRQILVLGPQPIQ